MGVSVNDLFGDGAGAQPAIPETYGQPPSGFRLPETTRLGAVRLQVADLGRSIDYYEGTLGLLTLDRQGRRAVLGAHDSSRAIVELHEQPGARAAPQRGRLGLYHFAILLPDRPSLGRFLKHLSAIGARAGASDHLVSEALYLQDPDNLGIEVYRDRPRGEWRRVDRQLMMATDPLDAPGLVRAAGSTPWSGMPAGTTIGHIHLHVGNIEGATAFYSEALGFDRMVWMYPGALFLAAGGYHHHLGTNTWAGSGARPPSADDAQLLEWTVELPDADALDAARESLERAGFAAERDPDAERGSALLVRDPWGQRVRIALFR